MTELASRRRRIPWHERERDVFWIDPRTMTLASILDRAPVTTKLIYLSGPRPGGDHAGFMAWLCAGLPAGWQPGAHYLDKPHVPVLRYHRPNGEGTVEVHRAATWGLPDAASAAQCEAAIQRVDTRLRVKFDRGAALLATPGATGRDLFVRTIPSTVEYPVLDDEWQTTIRATSTQGRIELLPGGDELAGVVCLDMRWAYAALCTALGAGPPIHRPRTHEMFDVWAPARYRARVTVPRDWAHIGIAPEAREGGIGWSWPSEPGYQWTTWLDASELRLALQNNWHVDVIEYLTYQPARPLDLWIRKLREVRDLVSDRNDDVSDLAARIVRAIVLHTIGAFQGRAQKRTRLVHESERHKIPESAMFHGELKPFGDHWTWNEHATPAWPETIHPEWSSAVWARCRAKLTEAALRLPRERVIGMHTDALYVTDHPGWVDDGRPGSWALRWKRRGPLAYPRTRAALSALAPKGEEHGER